MDEDESANSIDSIKLEYIFQRGQKNQVSKVTNNTNNTLQQHILNKVLASNTISNNSVFNIQLSYNINQALDPNEWNGDFYTISLHGFMKYLVSNIKNIKDSLHRMEKYIQGKVIDGNPNNIKDLEGVGKAVWKFLSSIYNLYWDGLYMNKANTTFRNKVKSKFTSQVPKSTENNKGKKVIKPTFISLIPPPIPAKL